MSKAERLFEIEVEGVIYPYDGLYDDTDFQCGAYDGMEEDTPADAKIRRDKKGNRVWMAGAWKYTDNGGRVGFQSYYANGEWTKTEGVLLLRVWDKL
jgi:hypothetical protein